MDDRDPLASIRSTIDEVTGLYNRRMLYDRLRAEIARSRRFEFECSCAILEIRELEQVGERFGLGGGERVLKEVASILLSSIRLYDGLFRCSGDQLAIVLPQAHAAEATAVGRRIARRIEEHPFTLGGEQLHVAVAFGLATFPQDAQDSDGLLRVAEEALDAARQAADAAS